MNNHDFKQFKTTDGRTVTVRRMLPADVNHLVTLYRHLSPETLYARFQEPAANLPPWRVLNEARALAENGYRQGQGVLAFVDIAGQGPTPVAAARYIRLSPDAAETSITVRDDFQRQGIGRHLLAILAEEARKEGITKLIANVSATNRGVLKLLSRAPYPAKREHYGPEMSVELDLTRDQKA